MVEVGRLLVLAGATVADMDELPPSVPALLDASDRVFVATPPLPSRIDWLMSDTDRAVHEAAFEADHILIALRSSEHADWQEKGLLKQIAESAHLPMTVFEIDEDGRARDRTPG